jgi:tRNA(His) 5'-end guanylyltransferase
MVETAKALLSELDGIYAYTESDEISVLFPPDCDLFDRSLEKIVVVLLCKGWRKLRRLNFQHS